MKKDNDKKILDLIGNDKTFDEGITLLINTYQESLYWHIRRMLHNHSDTDDVLQNVFVKVFKNIKGFKQESKLFTWLYRIATNESITQIKKRKVTIDFDEALASQMNKKSEPYFDADKAQIVLKKAIETLPQKQMVVFNLRYYNEMSYSDMSEVLDTSIGALKATFHHAVKKVELYLKNNIQAI